MKKLRKLGASAFLTLALAMSVMAGETQTPPCAPTEPGQSPIPPCATAPNGLSTFTATSTAKTDMGTAAMSNQTLLTRIAADVLLNFLPLF